MKKILIASLVTITLSACFDNQSVEKKPVVLNDHEYKYLFCPNEPNDVSYLVIIQPEIKRVHWSLAVIRSGYHMNLDESDFTYLSDDPSCSQIIKYKSQRYNNFSMPKGDCYSAAKDGEFINIHREDLTLYNTTMYKSGMQSTSKYECQLVSKDVLAQSIDEFVAEKNAKSYESKPVPKANPNNKI